MVTFTSSIRYLAATSSSRNLSGVIQEEAKAGLVSKSA